MADEYLIKWNTAETKDGPKSNPRRIDGKPPNRLEQMILRPLAAWLEAHPCIGARILGSGKSFYACVPGEMTQLESSVVFLETLDRYFLETEGQDDVFKSLLVLFHDPISSEQDFFDKFWSFSQTTHDLDSLTHAWDPNVSSDVNDPNFELSFRGRGVFPTTFHPFSPRTARRFMYPGWAHNLSSQFAKLRERGEFENWQSTIRKADASGDPSGLPNPLLADFGAESAAAQFAQIRAPTYPFQARSEADRGQVLASLTARAHNEKSERALKYLDTLS